MRDLVVDQARGVNTTVQVEGRDLVLRDNEHEVVEATNGDIRVSISEVFNGLQSGCRVTLHALTLVPSSEELDIVIELPMASMAVFSGVLLDPVSSRNHRPQVAEGEDQNAIPANYVSVGIGLLRLHDD
jgi:hypothetical protein